MAWDAAKRKSVQGYTPGLGTPYPDATKPVGWRAAVAWLFSADSYPAPPTPSAGGLNIGSNLSASIDGLNWGDGLNIGSGLSAFISLLMGGQYARA